ncbi:MAG: Fic family protein [Terracidiphilus sp.]|jgi:cell filamentation protein
MPRYRAGIDPHFDDEHGILKNLPGITDQAKLDQFEAAEAAVAMIRLSFFPVQGSFDTVHLKEIHKRIFQTIYPWAGEFRQVNIERSGSYPFAVVQYLEGNLKSSFAKLATEGYLKGLDRDGFARRAAYYLGELNTIHPFRDGNGRTQREFIRELAVKAGYQVSWNRVTREQMIEASIESHNLGRNGAFAELIGLAIEPVRPAL